jgi:hypothetical protein
MRSAACTWNNAHDGETPLTNDEVSGQSIIAAFLIYIVIRC